MSPKNALFALALLGLAAGCSSGGPQFGRHDGGLGDGSMQNGDAALGQADMTQLPPYPQGATGGHPGNILPNFTLQGYRLAPGMTDSTQLTWDTIKIEEYYHNPACACMFVTIGALWCGACQQEQPQLVQDVAGDPSFCVLSIVQEGEAQQSAATMSDVDVWTQNFMQNFYVVQGTPQTENLFQGYGTTIGLPFGLVVKPSTMTILDASQYDPQGGGAIQGFSPQIHDIAVQMCNAAP
jgi:hypothetical protein